MHRGATALCVHRRRLDNAFVDQVGIISGQAGMCVVFGRSSRERRDHPDVSPATVQALSRALPPRHFGDSGAAAPVRVHASSV